MSTRFMDTERDLHDVLRERATGIAEPEDPTKKLRRKLFGHSWQSEESQTSDSPAVEAPNPEEPIESVG